MRHTSGLSVTYGEEFEIALPDLAAAEKFGWPVAGPEAYPCAMRINPGMAVRTPLVWELELLESVLRAVPVFIDAKTDGLAKTVPTATGELTLKLSWLEEV